MASTSQHEPARNRPASAPADPHAEEHEDHGHSVAAWTSVCVVMLGSFIACIAVVLSSLWLFIVGVVVIVVGGVLAKLLTAMGYGSTGRSTQ